MTKYFYAFIFLLAIILLFGCNNKIPYRIYNSNSLRITKVAKGVYIHTSYLATQNYGKVACNGMFIIKDGIAIVCDTPTDDKASEELIEWISKDGKASINAVVVTHFHVDCLGGLSSFHNIGVPSYAQHHTIELAENHWDMVPKNGFDQTLNLPVGDATLISEFHGAGHTRDNIVCFYEDQQILFGGCLIKSVGASKGNLNDADVKTWSETVRQVRSVYPNAEVVIPGHGEHGDAKLLDYTISLFEKWG